MFAKSPRSVAYTAHHHLPAGGGARIVGRRVPGVNGISWAVRYDSDTDPNDPATGRRSNCSPPPANPSADAAVQGPYVRLSLGRWAAAVRR